MVSEATLVFLITGAVTVAALMVRMVYKSKCTHVEFCWGACTADRDVRGEEQLDARTPPGESSAGDAV